MTPYRNGKSREEDILKCEGKERQVVLSLVLCLQSKVLANQRQKTRLNLREALDPDEMERMAKYRTVDAQ
jgi:hypothetical protein